MCICVCVCVCLCLICLHLSRSPFVSLSISLSLTHTDVKSEFFLASDASAIVEHTKRVIFLEDDDVALIRNGQLTIHRMKHAKDPSRPVHVRCVCVCVCVCIRTPECNAGIKICN
jgi:hypothetical protein